MFGGLTMQYDEACYHILAWWGAAAYFGSFDQYPIQAVTQQACNRHRSSNKGLIQLQKLCERVNKN